MGYEERGFAVCVQARWRGALAAMASKIYQDGVAEFDTRVTLQLTKCTDDRSSCRPRVIEIPNLRLWNIQLVL